MQTDKDKILDDIFSNDPFGLLAVKPGSAPRTADDRLIESFQQLNEFYEKHQREPELGKGPQEHMLYSRLKSIREDNVKAESLKHVDIHGLLNFTKKEFNSLNDIFSDDSFGLLDSEEKSLFELKHVKPTTERQDADFIARRKPIKDFSRYEQLFKDVQHDLKSGKRKLVKFKQENLRAKTFYVHNGILLYLDSIKFDKQIQTYNSGTINRPDGRTKTIFENGTESRMKFQSLYKALHENGMVVTENIDKITEEFTENFAKISVEDKEAGYIYVLKSKSTHPDIVNVLNLYKIGYSEIEVEKRIKNASKEATYLMAEVEIISVFKCYNMNPQKFEKLLHNFFGNSCLDIDISGINGLRHTPREWFVAPIEVITQAIHLIITGEILKFRYDLENQVIVLK